MALERRRRPDEALSLTFQGSSLLRASADLSFPESGVVSHEPLGESTGEGALDSRDVNVHNREVPRPRRASRGSAVPPTISNGADPR